MGDPVGIVADGAVGGNGRAVTLLEGEKYDRSCLALPSVGVPHSNPGLPEGKMDSGTVAPKELANADQ
jgi:hypothetical protein